MDLGIMLSSIWLATIVLSMTGDIILTVRIYKDLADCGYRMNSEKINEISSQTESSTSDSLRLRYLIPFYNLYQTFQLMVGYSNQRDELLRKLDNMGIFEAMSDYEIREYDKNPTGLNALFVQGNYKEKMEKSKTITVDEGKIWYILDEETSEIEILKTEGAVSRLSLEEQEAKIIEVKNKQLQETLESKQPGINKTRLEKIEDLKRLKQEYTDRKKEKGYQKTNKKDK